MPYYDYEDLLDDEEFGAVKKKPKKVKVTFAKKPIAKGFATNIRRQRQSSNVIDLRGMRPVQVEGKLTWNTFWHLASSTRGAITNCLEKRGFAVDSMNVLSIVTGGSDYYFVIKLNVYDQFSNDQVTASVRNALKDVAIPSSIKLNNAVSLSGG
jgi:hypothetical protein